MANSSVTLLKMQSAVSKETLKVEFITRGRVDAKQYSHYLVTYIKDGVKTERDCSEYSGIAEFIRTCSEQILQHNRDRQHSLA